jgi:dolichol-phosphate mannosyltransferase
MLVSCVIGVVDEEESLIETVNLVLKHTSSPIEYEIILVIAPFASKASREISNEMTSRDSRIQLEEQKFPGIGGAYKQGFQEASGDIVILMSSDLETDPSLVPIMISNLVSNPKIDIVAVSRWINSNSFEGYSPILRTLNFIFQKLIRLVYGYNLTDFTYAFRAYRSDSLKGINWTERSHSFFLESLLRPLIRGASVMEIPGKWVARTQGVRHVERSAYWHYLKLAITLRLEKKSL